MARNKSTSDDTQAAREQAEIVGLVTPAPRNQSVARAEKGVQDLRWV
jgi:hypothetical protein